MTAQMSPQGHRTALPCTETLRILVLALAVGGLLTSAAVALDFNFNPEPGMSQQAIDGFEAAGQLWSDIYEDDVTVNIDIGFRNLRPSVLAQTGSQRIQVTYQQFVDALNADANSSDDASILGHLQSPADFDMLLNRTSNSPHGPGNANPFLDDDGDDNNVSIRLTRANAKALGLLDAQAPELDASITFSSRFNWDFDPSDGTQANHFPFVLVAAHEIGHMLGFTSGVDILDINSPPESGPFPDHAFTWVSAKDVFRFSEESVDEAQSVIDWTADIRDKFFSIDGGAASLGSFATGRHFGDGQQASHWKDDRGLGLMDPTVAAGETPTITERDIRLFDVVGWDLPEPPTPIQADLALNVDTTVEVTWVITAENLGPDDVTGATVDDVFPPGVTAVTWQCAGSNGATCTASGSGDIHDLVDLPAGSEVTFTATGDATDVGPNSATVTAPGGVTDDPSNNSGG